MKPRLLNALIVVLMLTVLAPLLPFFAADLARRFLKTGSFSAGSAAA